MISVIIPTLNEARRLPAVLSALRRERSPHEIIVADGGSRDGTPELAAASGAHVVRADPGRGAQLRAGANAARGEILLFLHADSQLPAEGLAHIAAALHRDPSAVGGNFRVIFDGDSGFARWLTGFYAWFRGHGLYYGDSGVFVRRDAYDTLGGIKPLPLMEDFDFTQRLEAHGPTICIGEPALVTSSRRFANRHPIAIFSGWLVIHALFYLGVSPERLARIYYRRGGVLSRPETRATLGRPT